MNYTQKIALLISSLTEPMLVLVLLALMGAWQSGIRGVAYWAIVGYAMIMSFFVVFIRLLVSSKLKTNWDLSDRAKRVTASKIFIAMGVITIFILYFWHNMSFIRFAIEVLCWYAIFALCTTKVKISGHLGVVTLFIGYLYLWYGWVASPLFLLLPLIAWSRLLLKRHTLIEVIGGTLYSVLFLSVTHLAHF